jgi:hypothetical protein
MYRFKYLQAAPDIPVVLYVKGMSTFYLLNHSRLLAKATIRAHAAFLFALLKKRKNNFGFLITLYIFVVIIYNTGVYFIISPKRMNPVTFPSPGFCQPVFQCCFRGLTTPDKNVS